MNKNGIGRELFIIVNKMKRYLDKQNQKHQIPIGQARILRYIYDSISKKEVIYQSDLKEAFSLRGASITGFLDMLTKQGYVVRIEDPIDRRKKSLELTDIGKMKAIESIKIITQFENELTSIFTKEELKMIDSVFIKLEKWIDMKESIEDDKTI